MADEILARLEAKDVLLWFEGDRLRFRAPKGALDDPTREALASEREAMVAALRARAAETEVIISATPGQQMHWFNHHADPGSAAYNCAFAARVHSPVDVTAMRQALQALSDRHAALRTTFSWANEGLLQKAIGWKPVAFDQHDVSGLDEAALQDTISRVMTAPFDLANGPTFRASLHSRAVDDHVLVIAGHHIVFDGASLFKALTELRALYAEATRHAQIALSRPSGSPAEFARWHQALLASPEGARMESYWREALSAPGWRIKLPADKSPGDSPADMRVSSVQIKSTLMKSIRKACVAYGVTSFVLMLAAYKAVLHRWTGADDVVVGTPTSFGRTRLEFADAIGDFVNTLPLRTRISPQSRPIDLIEQVRNSLSGAIGAQDLPFARIVEIIQPARVAGRTPLIETMFNYMRFQEFGELRAVLMPPTDGSYADFAGLRLSSYPIRQLTGAFGLQLQIADLGETLLAQWGYDGVMFELATIQRLSADYLRALEIFSEMSERTVDTIPCSRTELIETGARFLAELASRDINCTLDGDKLKISAPKGALDAATKNELSASRDAIMAALKAHSPKSAAKIRPIGPGQRFELSFAQQRLWFLDRMSPGAVQYNIGVAVRLRGSLDPDLLKDAIADLFARHEAFRTRIFIADGAPGVEILPESRASIESIDLTATELAERDTVAVAVANATLRTPLDLDGGRLATVRIASFAADDHVLTFSMHHIASDGWSLAIAMREIREFYDARCKGRAATLAPLTLRYVDFAAWERNRAATRGFDDSLSYWRSTLAGAPPVLDLPTDRPRLPSGSARGARLRAYFDGALIERLDKTARARGATLFMALLAIWQTLMSRLSGQDDIVVGTPVAARDDPALEDIIGLLVNNVPLRTAIKGAPSFASLLAQTKETMLEAFEHAALPFEAIVEAVNPVRTAAHAPIFQTFLALMNFPFDAQGPGGAAMEAVETEIGTARFDLSLELAEAKAGPHMGKMLALYEYSADLFDETTIARWHGHFERLIAAACEAPDAALADVPMVAPEEACALHQAWNGVPLPHDRTRVAHGLLEEAARHFPDSIALIAADEKLSYAAFEARANRLANVMIARGVKPHDRVAVCLDRGLDLPIALAAAWKAGAAYVPLDPTHPPRRLRHVLENAEIACAVTTSDLREIFEDVNATLVQLDADADVIACAPETAPSVPVAADDLAYVIYTSGSTGRPKGVEIEHRNLVAFLEAMRRTPGLAAGQKLLAVTTPSFDISGLEFWLPLSVGATVIIASREDTLDGERLSKLLGHHDVSFFQATPATWRLLLDSGWAGNANLTAVCGGEAMPQDIAQALIPRVRALWNVYGPTETTIWSAIHRVVAAEARTPIGVPIANTRVYVLDSTGLPAPIGAPGELVIAGEGVARGYRNHPELNAVKFVEIAPLGAPERAFRTGDLARRRADGTLEFLGRGDGQVKIRGFRIELGEIEARLTALQEVAAAVVAAREDEPGDKRLVAYIVTTPGTLLDEAKLRTELRETLPDYMIPSAYVQLAKLPLSPNGKVDRNALPAPTRGFGSAKPDAAEALMTPAQRRVAALWRQVLRVDRVGLHQNFFDLGGHSLLLVKLQMGLMAEFGQEIAIVDLFQRTTVASQAERLGASDIAEDGLKRALARAGKQVHV